MMASQKAKSFTTEFTEIAEVTEQG